MSNSSGLSNMQTPAAEVSVPEARYRRLFETARDGILVVDVVSQQIVDANPWAARLLGYSRPEMVGRQLWEVGVFLDEQASRHAFQELQRQGSVRYENLPLRTQVGEQHKVEFVGSRYEENGQVFAQCNIRDITKRQHVEQSLPEGSDRFRTVAEFLPQKILITNSAGEVDYLNQEWLEFSGLPFEQIKGVGWMHLLHPEDVGETIRQWRHTIQTGQLFQLEHRILRADGVYRWHLCRARMMLGTQSNEMMWIVSSTDIDERKQAEEKLWQLMKSEQAARAEAERANRIKDEFLAMLSHELRTPITAILGYTFWLRSGRLNEADADHALNVIEQNAKEQAQLTEDILDISRIIAGKLPLEEQPVNLAPVIESALDSLLPTVQTRDIAVTTHLDADVGLVKGDPHRLLQVVLNLLTNALKFTPQNGSIEVRLQESDSQAQITVSDNGQGIAADFLPFVFDNFRQADSTDTREHGGLGLGLAIVRNIVEGHGGTVQAFSPGKGQGASFVVRLPLLLTAFSSS